MPIDPSTGQMIPAQPIAYQPPAGAQPAGGMPGSPQGTVPVFNTGASNPGISGAIVNAVKALAMAVAPSVHKAAQQKINGAQAEGGGSPSVSQSDSLGTQLGQ